MVCLVSIRALNLEAGDKTYAENGKRCKLNALKISCNNSLECDSLKWEKPVGMECVMPCWGLISSLTAANSGSSPHGSQLICCASSPRAVLCCAAVCSHAPPVCISGCLSHLFWERCCSHSLLCPPLILNVLITINERDLCQASNVRH